MRSQALYLSPALSALLITLPASLCHASPNGAGSGGSPWLWGTLFVLLALAFVVLKLGRSPFGEESDVWSAQQVCAQLAERLECSAEELERLWGAPSSNPELSARVASTLKRVDREWSPQGTGEEVKVRLSLTWHEGKVTTLIATPAWSDLPDEVRARLLKGDNSTHTQPLHLPFSAR
jgi:hypothetical protein